VRNHRLAKSINDASWSMFRQWLEYFGSIYGVPVIAVAPHWTSQDCSQCGEKVLKALSTRTHQCPHCGYNATRDENSAKNILKKALAHPPFAPLGKGGGMAHRNQRLWRESPVKLCCDGGECQ
jgi:transposase